MLSSDECNAEVKCLFMFGSCESYDFLSGTSCFQRILFSVDPMYAPVAESLFSLSSLHLKSHLTEALHFVLSAVRQAALCGAVERGTLSLLPLKAPT